MKKRKVLVLIMALAMLALSACGKSVFGLSENTEKRMTITAENADKDAFFMVGSLEVEDGEQIVFTSNLTKGAVRVEIVGAPGESIGQIPDLNPPAILTAELTGTDGISGTVPAGSYLLKATCLQKATGTITAEVLPA